MILRDDKGRFIKGCKFNLGKKFSEEQRKNMSKARKGKALTNEHRKNIIKSLIGNKRRLGTLQTEETKRKIGRAVKKAMKSELVRKKISDKLAGIKKSVKTRKKMSLAMKGRIFTEEHKRKMSENHADFRGEKSPMWKGGISRAYKTGYYSKQYKEWRETVFERDNYACQECGIRSGNGQAIYLTAHHIKSFAKYPELRFDVSNGRTLCEDCHCRLDKYRAKFMRKGGTVDNFCERSL